MNEIMFYTHTEHTLSMLASAAAAVGGRRQPAKSTRLTMR